MTILSSPRSLGTYPGLLMKADSCFRKLGLSAIQANCPQTIYDVVV
jgi:hypothetical protein